MVVGMMGKVGVERDDVVHQPKREYLDIGFMTLAADEFSPRGK